MVAGLHLNVLFVMSKQLNAYILTGGSSRRFGSDKAACMIHGNTFLDNIHKIFMDVKIYRKIFDKFLEKFRKKVDKFERKYESLGFLALVLFVAIPLPITGAWTGCLASWLLDFG